MAWIKMRVELRNHPKVVRMASALKADRLRVIGGLWAVWATFDTHSEDGELVGYTLAAMDEDLGWRGFAAAMEAIAWLEETETGLIIPEFDEHNGASAKRRAQDTKLKKSNREADKSANGSWTPTGQMSADDADINRTRVREEKEKEEYPPTPKGAVAKVAGFPPGFDRFWAAYPRKVGKDAAAKAFAKRRPDAAMVEAMLASIAAQGLAERCARGEERFVPHPSTWLSEGRWQDEPSVSSLFAGPAEGRTGNGVAL